MPKQKRPKKAKFTEVAPESDVLYVNDSTGICLFVDRENEMRTYEQMLAGFYRANADLNPIAFEKVDDVGSAIATKDWYAVMYRGWHIRIISGKETPGPHSVQLWYKSGTEKKSFWVATLQLMAFFHNEEEVKEALLQTIRDQEFYISPKERKFQFQP